MGLFSRFKKGPATLHERLAELETDLLHEEESHAKLSVLRAERQGLLRNIELERLADLAKARATDNAVAYAVHDEAIARLLELAPPVLILLGVVRATGPDGGAGSNIEFRCEGRLVNATADLAKSLGVDAVNGGPISRGLFPVVPRSLEDARRALEGIK